jgi:hypothetical protein
MRQSRFGAFLAGVSALLIFGPVADGRVKSASRAVDVFAQIKAASARTYGTDFQCVNDCTRAGYQYNLCYSKCSYPSPGQNPPGYGSPAPGGGVHGTDYQCVGRCTQQGYQYPLCVSRCSY